MDEKLLESLLHEGEEKDWFDFKRELKLYQDDGKLVDIKRDELIKDILGLANGNSHIIRKTKYLIIGADDKKFEEDGCRVVHDVIYPIPTRSDLMKWLSSASSPAITGLESEVVDFKGKHLWIISILPTFDLHEIIRDLNTPKQFRKYTVFMRQDEHTVPASVRDGVAIEKLKHLHRQEIENPSVIVTGALAGAVVAFIISKAKLNSINLDFQLSKNIFQIFSILLGVIYGTAIGWYAKILSSLRYDFRYMTWQRKIAIILLFLLLVVALFFILR